MPMILEIIMKIRLLLLLSFFLKKFLYNNSLIIMNTVELEKDLKKKSESQCVFQGISDKITQILDNGDYQKINVNDTNINSNNNSNNLLTYIILGCIIAYLIYLFC